MAIDPNKFKIDKTAVTDDEMDEALALLEQKRIHDARVDAGEIKGSYAKKWADMSEEQREKAKGYARRRQARQTLIIRKAILQGIKVSEDEIDVFLKSQGKALSTDEASEVATEASA